ncbi:hypothetical protein JOQ06_012544 [Pogonophryne albipinna]|uniref:Arf-GAP with coiled-coil, ANK repeat and PH domain-containing protein n=1 Tax=Pogonophryne albipinna TaxID=1090488 RepID=A0AAD6A925_9TELE|nr:hypothetical protein JOQ06_012544 [Pogonophryne albipinna]
MDSLLDFEECVKDSPEFRLKLELFEADVNVLETHLDKVMKLCGKMVEAGQMYNAANQLFLSGLAELSMFHQKDSVINILFDQTQRAISQQLTNLCTQDLIGLSSVSLTNQVMKLCGKMVEAGQVYNAANQLFLSGLAELSMFHQKDSVINNCLNQFNQGLQEMISFHTILFDQTQRAISQQLTNLCTQ